jgi:hypothetical protein
MMMMMMMMIVMRVMVLGLFKVAFQLNSCTASNGRMTVNLKLERIWRETAMTYFKALFWHLRVGNKENHEKCKPEYPVSWQTSKKRNFTNTKKDY